MHCINHFFSPTRKEGIKNTPTKPEVPPHDLPDVEDILNIAQDIREIESAKINYGETDNTGTYLNSDEETNIKFNQEQAEYADSEVGKHNHRQATENDLIVINDAELKQDAVKESLMTPQISSGRAEQTGISHMIQLKSKNEEIKQPHGNEVSLDATKPIIVKLDDEKMNGLSRKVVHMSVTTESIKKKIKLKKHERRRDKHEVSVKFRSEIDPATSQAAEQELRREISQDMFAQVSNDIHPHTSL